MKIPEKIKVRSYYERMPIEEALGNIAEEITKTQLKINELIDYLKDLEAKGL